MAYPTDFARNKRSQFKYFKKISEQMINPSAYETNRHVDDESCEINNVRLLYRALSLAFYAFRKI